MGINSTPTKMTRQIFSPSALIILIPILGVIVTSEWLKSKSLQSDLSEISDIRNEIRAKRNALDSVRFIYLSPANSNSLNKDSDPVEDIDVGPADTVSGSSPSKEIDNLSRLRQYYALVPPEDRVVIYWPLSRYHETSKTNGTGLILGKKKVDINTITSKDTTEILHFQELTQILHAAKSNAPLGDGIVNDKECFLLLCTKNILPHGKPPVYDLFKSVKIDDQKYNVLMEIRSEEGLSYLLIKYKINVRNKENKVVWIEKKNNGSSQKTEFKTSDLSKGVYLLKTD